MEKFEETITKEMPPNVEPRLWKSYVDNTFAIVNRHHVDNTLKYLNNFHHDIQFTMETESDGHLPCLEYLVTRDENGQLKTTIYRKPTNTDRYLHYRSAHPQYVKTGVIQCLTSRVNKICSNNRKTTNFTLVALYYP